MHCFFCIVTSAEGNRWTTSESVDWLCSRATRAKLELQVSAVIASPSGPVGAQRTACSLQAFRLFTLWPNSSLQVWSRSFLCIFFFFRARKQHLLALWPLTLLFDTSVSQFLRCQTTENTGRGCKCWKTEVVSVHKRKEQTITRTQRLSWTQKELINWNDVKMIKVKTEAVWLAGLRLRGCVRRTLFSHPHPEKSPTV